MILVPQHLSQSAAEFAKTQPKDHLRNLVIAAVQAIPVIGGSLGTLLQEYAPNWKAERLQEFLQKLAEDFERMSGEVSAKAAATEEYGLLVEEVLRKVSQISNNEREKLRAYRAILLNTVRPNPPDKLKRDHFLGLLDRLQEVHILLISVFYDPAAFATAHSVAGFARLPSTLKRVIEEFVKPFGLDGEFYETVLMDLETFGIAKRREQSPVNYEPTFENRSSCEHELKAKLTGHGRNFAHFITLPS
jgi:hypothetical protein